MVRIILTADRALFTDYHGFDFLDLDCACYTG